MCIKTAFCLSREWSLYANYTVDYESLNYVIFYIVHYATVYHDKSHTISLPTICLTIRQFNIFLMDLKSLVIDTLAVYSFSSLQHPCLCQSSITL